MSDRTQPRTRVLARVVGGLVAGAATLVLVVGGGTPAQAAPTPVPSPGVSTAPGLSVHIDLPGLLNVHVDLPPLSGLLGGRPATTAPAATSGNAPSAAPTTSVPVARPTPTRAPTSAPRPVERPRSTPRPQRSAERNDGAGSAPGFDTGRVVRAPRSAQPRADKTTVRKRIVEKADEVLHRPLSPGAPAWLLIGVVGLCAIGTATVVRLAGRKDRPGT